MQSELDASLDELNRELRAVGRLPRLLALSLLVVGVAVGAVGWLNSGSVVLALIVVGGPLTFAALSLRIRACATAEFLEVRSYLRAQSHPFDEVLAFTDLPYSGLWNRGAGTESWLNLGLRMIDVTRQNGSGRAMPSTMMSRSACARVVRLLNARLSARDDAVADPP